MKGIQWSDLLFNLSISLFGGLVKTITSKSKDKSFSRFLVSAIVGGFAGLLTYMVCSNFNMSWQMTSFATGVAGYMGDSILELFSDLLPKLLTSKLNITVESKEVESETKKSSKSKRS